MANINGQMYVCISPKWNRNSAETVYFLVADIINAWNWSMAVNLRNLLAFLSSVHKEAENDVCVEHLAARFAPILIRHEAMERESLHGR